MVSFDISVSLSVIFALYHNCDRPVTALYHHCAFRKLTLGIFPPYSCDLFHKHPAMAGKQHEIRTELRKLLEDSEAENLALKKLILALHEEEARARVAGESLEEPVHHNSGSETSTNK